MSLAGQHASTTILAPAVACHCTRILAGHSQFASNASTATCEYRLLQVSIKPVLSVYLQSNLQWTCSLKCSKCNIACSKLRIRFPRGTPFWDAENSELFGEAISASFDNLLIRVLIQNSWHYLPLHLAVPAVTRRVPWPVSNASTATCGYRFCK
jgi:hypothetical protein